MSFDELLLISPRNLFREARVSDDCGERVLNELRAARAINPVTTPTGRKLLTPADGKRLFEAITKVA